MQQIGLQHRLAVEHVNEHLGLNCGRGIVKPGDHSGKPLIAEWDQHAPAYDRLAAVAPDAICEHAFQRQGNRDIAKLRHAYWFSGLLGAVSPISFMTICRSFHASFFCRGSRSRNAGW